MAEQQHDRRHIDMADKCSRDHITFIQNFLELWTPVVGLEAVICAMAGVFTGAVISCVEVMAEFDPVMAKMLRERCLQHLKNGVKKCGS